MTRATHKHYISAGLGARWHIWAVQIGDISRGWCGEGPIFHAQHRDRKPRIRYMCPVCQAEWERLSGYKPKREVTLDDETR